MRYFSCNSESSIIACDAYYYSSSSKHKNKRKHKKNKQRHQNHHHHQQQQRSTIRRFSYADLETATNSFSTETFLGKGSHGSVYKAVLDDGNLTVAVKKDNNKTCTVTPGDNEIEILSKIHNPNFVNLLGFCSDSNEKNKLIVVEYMANGSLYDLLHTNPTPPSWTKRVRFGLQIAKAVSALHSFNPPVIHRDIKSSNVLIDDDWNARLGDFGLSLRGYVEDVRIRCTPPAGTLGYLDPWYVAPENLSAKSDVFSFGILLLEILSGRNAIDVNYSPPSMLDWALPLIKHGEFVAICDRRIDLPEDLSVIQELAMVAARCVRSNAEKRLSMTEVVECLKIVYKKVASPIWNSFRRQMRKQPSLRDTKLSNSIHSSHWHRTLSNAQPSMEFRRKLEIRVSDHVRRRSNSIGSASEIRARNDLDFGGSLVGSVRRKPGVVVRIPAVKLSKSRSLGVMESAGLMHESQGRFVFELVKNPCVNGLDMSKLVISVEQGPLQQKEVGRRESL